MKFVLVHHGEPEAGSADAALSEAGLRQARAVAGELRLLGGRGDRHASVLTSPRPASRATAELIAETLELAPPEPEEALTAPLSGGDGLDALAALQDRAWAVIEALKQSQEPDATLVLVTDELTIRALVCHALSMPLEDMRRFDLQPGSLSVIEYRTQPRERTLIASLNETCHLEGIGHEHSA